MLFDLRSAGRRRTVKIVYGGLALLLVLGGLLGVGSGLSGGGIGDIFGGGGSSSQDVFAKQVKSAEKATAANPSDAGSWAKLARVRFQAAGTGDGYDQNTQTFTRSGKQDLLGVQQAWDRYLSLKPAKADERTASLMVQAFGPGALEKPTEAVKAMEVVLVTRKPSSALYGQYAQLAYLAGQSRKGDLASQKAVGLAPKASRKQVKDTLDQVKAQVAQQAAASASSGSGAGTASPITPSG